MKKIILSTLAIVAIFCTAIAQNDTTQADCFNNVEARVILPKESFLSGEKVEAEIVLLNTTCKGRAEANVVGWSSIKLKNGVAKYTTVAFGEGTKKIEGYVDYFIGDKYKRIGFEKEYIVHRGVTIISPDAMNVLYTGIENPISISVPGFAPEKMVVSLANGSLKNVGGTKFIAKVNKRGVAKLLVSVKMDDGATRSMGAMQFRVRNPPFLHAQIATLVNGDTYELDNLKKNIKSVPKVFIGFGEGFPFERMKFIVASYRFTIHKANGENSEPIEAQGQVLTPEILELIEGIEAGDKIIIDNIKAAAPDEEWKTSPFVVTAK